MKHPKKNNFFILIIILLIIFAAFLLTKQKSTTQIQDNSPTITSSTKQEASQSTAPNLVGKDEILKNALNLYIQKKAAGVDMENGPCLGSIGPDWVLDIAHNPRQPQDDLQKNQCADITEGRAHHFIELDPSGKLIRVD